MVGIGIISFIRYIFNLTKAFFINFSETVAETFCRCSIKSKMDSGFLFPCIRCTAQTIHQRFCKLTSLFRCLTLAGHQFRNFIQTDVSKRNSGITAMQQFIDFLSFLQTGNRTILPVNRTDITGYTLKRTVAAHQSFKAERQSFFQKLPKIFHIAFC